ncbi:MAG: AAA family ATPase [Planctomycetota bacterium]|nr:AAA family ATPase [Planctomycetota bacterium]
MSDITNPIFIRHLTPRNFLSFGPDNAGIDLQSLNVFIGPNGSGKSNLIEAISLMRATAKDLRDVVRRGGGVVDWIWKGNPTEAATVEWVVTGPKSSKPLRHTIEFKSVAKVFSLVDERVENETAAPGEDDPNFYYRYQHGQPVVNTKTTGQPRKLAKDSIEPDRSILVQRRDSEIYPEMTWLAENYEKIRIYREWSFGRNAVFREPQQTDMRSDVLAEDFSNLGLFLNRLKSHHPTAKRAILAGLNDLYEGITDFEVAMQERTVQVFFAEGDFAIPSTRLSNGTLHYLCLLAILCDPEPPPLICIEEPELGLHPDILPSLADLLLAASEKTQIIVTTHSDILVESMSETPECVVVFEKHEGKTEMNRLSSDELAEWLKEYSLGDLWIKGQLGGKRW